MPVQDVAAAIVSWKFTTPNYRALRDYYDGAHSLKFATPNWQEKYGSLLVGLRENLCEAVVDAHTDPVQVASWGVDTLDETEQAGLSRLLSWVTREAVKCGDAYVLVWPGPDGNPVAHFHRADQMVPHVDPTDPAMLDWLAKVWQAGAYGRVNVYYADRVERFISASPIAQEAGKTANVGDWPEKPDAWVPFTDDDGGDILPHSFGVVPACWWKRKPDGPHGYGKSVLSNVGPLQDLLNKSLADLAVASENIARPFWYLLNYKPELRLDPETGKPMLPPKFDRTKQNIFTTDSGGPMGQLEPPDPNMLLKVQDGIALKIARVSGVPAFYLTQTSGDVPSGESLRVLSSRLTSSVRAFESESEPVWRGLLELLGINGAPQWADPSPVSDTERGDLALQRKAIGLALEDVVEPLDLSDPEAAILRAQDATQAAQDATARQWAQGNLLNG